MSNFRYNDIQGNLTTAVSGVTTWTNRFLKTLNAFPVFPHIATTDIFHMTFQMSHAKRLGSPVASVHLHLIPTGVNGGTTAPTYGDTTLAIRWGWYNNLAEVAGTELPNAASNVVVTVADGDLWKLRIVPLVENLAPPANEGYSSILMVRAERLSAGNVFTGELAIAYMDAHIQVDRQGSILEYTDA
jgi:hypothetical protein